MAHVSFGQWLKQRHKALDLTQEELARLVGCAGETLCKIEADRLRPSTQIVACLAQQLSIAPEEHNAFMRFARAVAHALEDEEH
jgi:DNA-binding XRE family transcriptional regulator